MQRDEQRGDAALAEEPLRRGGPQPQVRRQRHGGEGHGEAGGRVEVRREVPQRHADVVLLGGQARRLAVGDLAHGRPAPGARELPGQPGVRRLADRHDAVVVRAQQHAASVTRRGRRRRLRRHGPPRPAPARPARPGRARRSAGGVRRRRRRRDQAVPARLRLGRGDGGVPGRGGRHAVGRGPAVGLVGLGARRRRRQRRRRHRRAGRLAPGRLPPRRRARPRAARARVPARRRVEPRLPALDAGRPALRAPDARAAAAPGPPGRPSRAAPLPRHAPRRPARRPAAVPDRQPLHAAAVGARRAGHAARPRGPRPRRPAPAASPGRPGGSTPAPWRSSASTPPTSPGGSATSSASGRR